MKVRTAARIAYELAHREARLASNKAWREANAERVKAQAAERRSSPKYRVKRAAYERTRRVVQREKHRAQRKVWEAANRGRIAKYTQDRKAAQLRATPSWADQGAIAAIYAEAARRRALGENVEVDHVVPLKGRTVSGLHVENNLQILDAGLNRSKRNKFGEPA